MKDAKEQYDGLVKKLQEGSKVPFGQMEQVFAEAFLKRFLQDLSAGKNTVQVPRNEEDEDSEEEPEVNEEQINYLKLEQARALISTLGVRPSIEDMMPYVTGALSEHDWQKLAKVLGMTKEGKLPNGTIEKAALEELASHGTHGRYNEIKEHFPDLKFTKEIVHPFYEKMMESVDGHSHPIKDMIDATQIPIQEELVLKAYDRIIEAGLVIKDKEKLTGKEMDVFAGKRFNRGPEVLRALTYLSASTGVKPKITPALEKMLEEIMIFSPGIAQLISGSRDSGLLSELDEWNSMAGIYSNEELMKKLQKTALQFGNIEGLAFLQRKTTARPDKEDIKQAYNAAAEKKNTDAVISIYESTKQPPEESALQLMYEKLFRLSKYDSVLELFGKTNVAPQFSKETIEKAPNIFLSEEMSQSAFKYAVGMCKVLKLAGTPLSNEAIKTYVLRQADTGYVSHGDLKQFIKDHAPELESLTTTIDVMKEAKELSGKLERAKTEYTNRDDGTSTPFLPWVRGNASRYVGFRKEAVKAINEHAKNIAKIREASPEAEIHKASVQYAYKNALEFLIVQLAHGEGQKIIPLEKLQEATGVPVDQETVCSAIDSFAELAHHIYKRPENSIAPKLAEKGITIADETFEKLVQDALKEKPISKAAYMKALTGKEFTPSIKSKMRERAVTALEEGNEWVFHDLKELGADAFTESDVSRLNRCAEHALDGHLGIYDVIAKHVQVKISDQAKQDLRYRIFNEIIGSIRRENKLDLNKYRELVKRTGPLPATPQELKEIVNFDIKAAMHHNYTPDTMGISKLLGCPLEPGHAEDIILSHFDSYQMRKYVQQLQKETGVQLTEQKIRAALKKDVGPRSNQLIALKDFNFTASEGLVNETFAKFEEVGGWPGFSDLAGAYKPSAEIGQRVLSTTLKKKLYTDWYGRNIVSALISQGLRLQEQDIDQAKGRILNEPLIYQLELIDALKRTYKATIEFKQHEKEVLFDDAVRILSQAYSPLKSAGDYSACSADLSELFKGMEEKASEKITEALKKGNHYQSYVFAKITGAKPKLSNEEIETMKKQYQTHQFRVGERKDYEKMLASWKVA